MIAALPSYSAFPHTSKDRDKLWVRITFLDGTRMTALMDGDILTYSPQGFEVQLPGRGGTPRAAWFVLRSQVREAVVLQVCGIGRESTLC